MSELEEFLALMVPRLEKADTALHNGDAVPRKALWSRHDPVTLFGASATESGWADVERVFDWLGAEFTKCDSFRYEIIAAGVSGDLAYIVGIEHTTAAVKGEDPVPYRLRVTTIFRREGSDWRIVHRHGDPPPGARSGGRGPGLFEDANRPRSLGSTGSESTRSSERAK